MRALEERDVVVERWLQTEVAQAFDELDADPASAVRAKEVFTELRKHVANRLANRH